MTDAQVIDAFIVHLREYGYPGLKVDRRPDEDNRNSHDIDAIAGQFAIEHTSVDSVQSQRRNDAWFDNVVGGLKSELAPAMDYRLRVVLPYDAIGPGQDWPAIRASITRWIRTVSPSLSDNYQRIEGVDGIPFPFNVSKRRSERPGLFFSRELPLDEFQVERIGIQLHRKIKKLMKYSENYTTVLLVENDNLVLMDEFRMREILGGIFPAGYPTEIDHVWYVDTSIQGEFLFEEIQG